MEGKWKWCSNVSFLVIFIVFSSSSIIFIWKIIESFCVFMGVFLGKRKFIIFEEEWFFVKWGCKFVIVKFGVVGVGEFVSFCESGDNIGEFFVLEE